MTESGFSKAQSNNLPRLDWFMVARFFANNELFSSAEIRGVKLDRASRDSYGDSAIGYVQVKREESICIVKGEICPEHRLNVTLEIDGNAEEFQSVLCHDCAAALGNHTLSVPTQCHIMVYEQSRIISTGIDNTIIINNKTWELEGINKMMLSDNDDDLNEMVDDINRRVTNKYFIKSILNEIIEGVLDSSSVMVRENNLGDDEKNRRNSNRTTSIIIQDYDDASVECVNRFVDVNLQRSVSEVLFVDENDNHKEIKQKPIKKTKKLSFNSIFNKLHKSKEQKHNNEEESESYDTFPATRNFPEFKGSLQTSRKYASALELGNPKPEKKSFFKKILSMGDNSSNFLRRSLSFRDVSRKKPKTPTVVEAKNQQWRQSLQSLVENDMSVSYKDLSFINYDALNQFNYTEPVRLRPGPGPGLEEPNGYVGRSQSMRERGSPGLLKPQVYRHTMSTPHSRSRPLSVQDLKRTTSAVSLPILYHGNTANQRNSAPSLRQSLLTVEYPEKPASEVCRSSNSIRSDSISGSGMVAYVKLRHHNATRQKYRHAATFSESRPRIPDVDDEIARESLKIEDEPQEGQEWKKFVGSIRRKVQRHASSSADHQTQAAQSDQSKKQPISRKNSLDTKRQLTKQKSVGLENASTSTSIQKTTSDYFRALNFRDKTSVGSSSGSSKGGVRNKSDNKNKSIRPNLSFGKGKSSSKSNKDAGLKHQDDFLKATMRIFLVVSPPAGKLQVRSRSLNHLDGLETSQSVVSTTETALKDFKSEPDCTKTTTGVGILPSSSTTTADKKTEPPDQSDGRASVRKHMLSRSQKSSSECFSVIFEVGDESTWDNELFFPAQRGVTLHDSLAKLCELRHVDLSACEARAQDKENSSEWLVSFSQDTYALVGRHIRILAKDTSNKKLQGSIYGNHSKKQSGSSRARTSSFFSSSTEDQTVAISSTLSLHESDQSRKQIKQRITAFFGNTKDTKYEALIEQLDRYSRQGIPQNVNYPQGQCESIDALYKLEDDWREIIVDYSDLSEKQQQQQTALWELIKTEVAYIKTLKVVTDLFLGCLRDLQSKNLFREISTEKLFSNITEILGANVIFWRNTLFPLVRDMRKYKRPSCLENMLEGFSKLHDTFQPYFKYCAEQSRCQHYCRENLESEVFTAYLTWCESQKECNRLRLMDILVQPMQRLTKYGLLLKAVLKNTDEDVEKESLQAMIKMVDDFVNNVNSSLKHRQDTERLKGIIARIESYDIVESRDDDIERILKRDKSLTQLDLTRPMLGCPQERKRHLLLEGDLKLKDTGASKIEVHCFLLTDVLLICKPSNKKGVATMKVIRQPYLVDRLTVQELTRETPSLAFIYRNEFDMAVATFILQNNDAKKLKGWKDGISKAQLLYSQAKQLSFMAADESLDYEYGLDTLESEYHSLQLVPRSPMASSSRASRVSSLAHSHSGSIEMNDQSSLGSAKDQSRGVSIENVNRTGSISSDEGVQPLTADIKSPLAGQKSTLKNRLFSKTPNTLSVQPVNSLGQSLPNLTLGSPNIGSGLCLNLHQNTLSVPSTNKNAGGTHLLSPTHRGVSYPPPSPTRGNLRRSLAISQSKNPPLIKTRQVNSVSSTSVSQGQVPASFDVPVIAGVSSSDQISESFNRGQQRQAIKRSQRYQTTGMVEDIKKIETIDSSHHQKILSRNNSTSSESPENDEGRT